MANAVCALLMMLVLVFGMVALGVRGVAVLLNTLYPDHPRILSVCFESVYASVKRASLRSLTCCGRKRFPVPPEKGSTRSPAAKVSPKQGGLPASIIKARTGREPGW